uniref:Endoribonuclease n=1 Tax=Heligmosomoides polygyrus TaxID=6339 RepID=A0A183GE42_HELPZ
LQPLSTEQKNYLAKINNIDRYWSPDRSMHSVIKVDITHCSNRNNMVYPMLHFLRGKITKLIFKVCTAEPAMTGFRKATIQAVMDTWTATPVFNLAFEYLKNKGAFLWNLWLGTYSRCGSTLGSSGWEHVFLGEWKSGTVDGQHDWARYYLLQKADKIDYHGYYSTVDSLTGTWQYTWENELKQKGGFLIGTSPVFDFSLLTVCALIHPGSNTCKFSIDGHPLAVTSYTQTCAAGLCLSTAYPTN